MSALRTQNPELAGFFDLYRACRSVQVVSLQHQKTTEVVETRVAMFPSGYSVLPEAGGFDDQPYRLTLLFEWFRLGETNGAFKKLSE